LFILIKFLSCAESVVDKWKANHAIADSEFAVFMVF